MILTGWDTYRYSLPMKRPLVLRGHTFHERAGLLIRLESEGGQSAWGEIAPLPGFSRETFDEVIYAVKRARYRLLNREIPAHLEELSGGFVRWLHDLPLPPSVQCGFEAAVLHLAARRRGVTPAELMSHRPQTEIAINGLISATPDEIEKEIERVVAAGFRAVKLKVGREDVDTDIATVRRLRARLPATVALRLDANRAWTYEQALAFADGIAGETIVYLEEPLAEPQQLERFAAATSLPLALDESLVGLAPEALVPFEGLRAIIVRPMLLGGLEQTMRLARRAQQFQLTPVLSSAIESIVGIGALANLAAVITADSVPVGLDTLNWFAEQPVTPYELPRADSISVEPVTAIAQQVDTEKLKRINHD